MIADTLYNENERVEITPYIAKTARTYTLTQVINTALSGMPHIQNVGDVSYQTQVDFILHKDKDSLLLRTWRKGDLVRVVDDEAIRYGYITSLKLGDEYAEGYHTGTLVLKEVLL